MNLAKLREERAFKQGERVVVIFEGREITNLELLRSSRKLAAALKNLGVKKGERVILQMPNCPEVLCSFAAVWRLGAVSVPINALAGEEETAYIYRDSGAKVVISSRAYLPKIAAGRAKAPGLEAVILIDGHAAGEGLSYRPLVESSPEEQAFEETDDEDIAVLIYTSGTTGKPKGVVHTHRSLYENARMQYESVVLPDGMTTIVVLPLCHAFGIAVMNNGLFRTGRTVLLNSFDPAVIFSSIEKYQASVLAAVPTLYVYFLMDPERKKHDMSSMKYWFSGSAPLAQETWRRFKEDFGFEIIEGWGLTEAGANNCVNPIHGVKKIGSIGLPMKGTDMQIVDRRGHPLGPGKKGEIVIRGPQLMRGYWNKPEETAEVLRDGWLHTGDEGYVDDDGYYFITDRMKDLIIKGGENISPRVIEEALVTNPKVSEAAVIAMKDDVYGENIKAFLVLNPGETATAEEIIDFCRMKLTNFLLPKEVAFLNSFPKSPVGKILKKELREW